LRRGPAILFLLVCLQGSGATPPGADPARGAGEPGDDLQRFERLSRDYLEAYFAAHPVRATQLGVHRHDASLPDLGRRAVAERAREVWRWLDRLQSIDPRRLPRDAAFDHRILDHAMRAELLELEEIRGWQRNPLAYERAIADGIATLIDGDFAPLDVRAANLVARLDGSAATLSTARRNLDDVPRLWAELAAGGARAIAGYLRDEAPVELGRQGLARIDPRLRRRLDRAQRDAIDRLERFARWIDDDLLPRATGDFRLGRELVERKLLYEEHVDLSVDELWRINEAAIADERARLERVARRIDARHDTLYVMGRINRDHPSPERLLDTAGAFVEQARRFVEARDLLTLPAEPLPAIRATPALSGGAFASTSTPGPFEPSGTRSFFNLTNVDPAWSRRLESEHLTYFNYPSLLGISVHEVMPGHFVQQMSRRGWSSDVRKVFLPTTVSEGWAHYAEQMMVDEGLGGGAPEVRLAQLRRALQRHVRWRASLSMHAFGGSLERASVDFREIAFFADFPAQREARRGTYDPMYLCYALGRMMILALREDYRHLVESRGQAFSLREFHDRFLALGLPLPLARDALLGEATPLGFGLHAQTAGQPVVVVEQRDDLHDVMDGGVVESASSEPLDVLP